jgi:hypothetical protein
MKVGEASILRLEPDGLMLVELFAQPVEPKSCHGHIVGRKGEQQSLRSGVGADGGFENEVEKLGERKAELAAVIGSGLRCLSVLRTTSATTAVDIRARLTPR